MKSLFVKGSLVLAFAAVSCLIWVLYGWTKSPKRDYILIVPNLAGVILGTLTFLTSF